MLTIAVVAELDGVWLLATLISGRSALSATSLGHDKAYHGGVEATIDPP